MHILRGKLPTALETRFFCFCQPLSTTINHGRRESTINGRTFSFSVLVPCSPGHKLARMSRTVSRYLGYLLRTQCIHSSTSATCISSPQLKSSPHPQMLDPLFIPPSELHIRHEPHLRPHLLHAHLRMHKNHPLPPLPTNLLLMLRRPLQTRINQQPSQPLSPV
jgi:hypothetical protein